MIRTTGDLLAQRKPATETEERIVSTGRGGGVLPVRQFRVKSVQDDYLICHAWNGTDEAGANINVAKPWCLRKNGQRFSGFTYTFTGAQSRTVKRDSDGVTENQVIVPTYYPDDVIYAVIPLGGTGVEVAGQAVRWVDLNTDGRAYSQAST